MKFSSYFIVTSLIILSFVSCKAKPSHNLCHCVNVSDPLNHLSASFFNRTATQQGKDSLDQLTAYRDEICQEYKEMPSVKLLEAAADCEKLQLDPTNK